MSSIFLKISILSPVVYTMRFCKLKILIFAFFCPAKYGNIWKDKNVKSEPFYGFIWHGILIDHPHFGVNLISRIHKDLWIYTWKSFDERF